MPDNEDPEKAKQATKPTLLDGTDFTQEQFAAQMASLTERARAAGLRPFQAMLATYMKQGLNLFDKVLEGLEPVDTQKKD